MLQLLFSGARKPNYSRLWYSCGAFKDTVCCGYLEGEDLRRQAESSPPDFNWGVAALLSSAAHSLTHNPTREYLHTAGLLLQHKCISAFTVGLAMTCLEETSYLLLMTLQGTPATVTEFWMSSARWPRLEPEMVTTVPPSTGPDTGSSWNARGPYTWHTHRIVVNLSKSTESKISSCIILLYPHKVDDRSRTGVLDLFSAGVVVHATRVFCTTTPNTAVLGIGSATSAAVWPSHWTVEQRHWKRRKWPLWQITVQNVQQLCVNSS